MRKYLAYYETEWPSNIAELTAVENKPFVGYLKGGGVQFTVIPKPVDYVTFTAKGKSYISLVQLSTNQTLEYSTDTTNWNTFDTTTKITLNKGENVYVRGILSAGNTSTDYTQFKMSGIGTIVASGNCNAIWNYKNLNAPLKAYCGYNMFRSCRLTTAPELPATTLAEGCYYLMFRDCSFLTPAPVLPATTLAPHCYHNMFVLCTSLTTAPELPATTLAEGCYDLMFHSCTVLTTAPKILPATELAKECYSQMFYNCTSLTTAPELPATTLAEGCYYLMFRDCTDLNHIKCLATDISATNCTREFLKNVSSTGTFIKHPDMHNWSDGNTEGIPYLWTVENAVL